MNKRIKDRETGQQEILKMIETLSSKVDSLTDKTSCDLNQGLNGVNSENVMLEARLIELNEFRQDVSHYMVTGVSPQTEIPPRSSSLPPPTRNTRTTWWTNCSNRSRMSPNRTSDFPDYRRHCQQLCPLSMDEMTNSSISKTSS